MITVVGALKGGTGKSTVSFNLALWLRENGFEVDLYDLDPQATLSDVIDIRAEEGYEPELSVSQELSVLRADSDVETIIDVGTADMEALKKAVSAADRVVIPVPPSQADVWSTQRFLKIVADACADGAQPDLFAFVNRADTNPAVRETLETQEALAQLDGLKVVTTRLGQRTPFRRSFSEGLAVFEMDPRSKAADEMGALATILYSSLFFKG
ncbi:MAG: nucleotide-binding protein [bacterium]